MNPEKRNTSSFKVLIIDDCAEDVIIFKRYLNRDPSQTYQIQETELGGTGLELCQSWQPDLILLDYLLPDMDGLEFLDTLLKERKELPCAIIAMTGLGDESVATQFMRYGVQDYLVKGKLTAEKCQRAVKDSLLAYQHKLQERYALHSAILESISDGFYALNAEERFIYVNGAAEKLGNIRREDVLGKKMSEVFPNLIELPAYTYYKRALTKEVPVEFETVLNATKRWVKVKIYPAEWGISVYFQDITLQKQNEEKIRLLERAVTATNNGVVITDATQPDNPIIFVNEGFEKLTGYQSDEIIGRNCRFLQQDDREQPDLAEIKAALEEKRACKAILRNYRKDGSLFWNELHLAPVFDSAGAVTHFVGIQNDITEQRQAEEALRQSEERLSLIFESLPVGVGLVDTKGQLFLANREMYHYLPNGLTPVEDRAGANRWLGYQPDGSPMERTDYPVMQALRGKRVLPGIEFLYTQDDGKQIWTRVAAQPFRDSEDQIVGSVAVVTNIDELKRTGEAQRQSEERFRAVADLVPDLLWSNDPGGATTWCNQRWLDYTGQLPEQALEYGWWDTIHPDDRTVALANSEETIKQGVPLRQEYRIRGNDGNYRWFLVQALPLKDEQGHTVRWFGAATDIHEQRLVREGLEQLVAGRTAAMQREIEEREQIQAALKEKEEHYRLLAENATDVIFKISEDTTILYVSPACYTVMGYTPEEMVGHSTLDFFHPEDRERITKVRNEVFQQNETMPFTYRARCRDGHYIWMENSGRTVEDPEGSLPSYTISVGRDITWRKLAEDALQEKQQFIERVTQASPDFIYVYDLHENQFVYSNKELAALLGYSSEEIQQMGSSLKEHLLHPDDVETFNSFRNHLQKVRDAEVMEYEYRLKKADGEWVWLNNREVIFSRNEEGLPRQILGIAHNVTSRKITVEWLRQSEERYRLLIENSIDLVFKNDANGVITYASPACRALLGYEPEELVGQSSVALFHPDDLNTVRNVIHNSPLKSTKFVVEHRYRRKDGSYIWLESSSQGMFDPVTGELLSISGAARDITARRQAEEALRESEERYYSLFNRGLYGVILLSLGKNKLIANPAACQMLGYTEEELPAISRRKLIDWSKFIKQFDLEQLRRDKKMQLEVEVIHKDGTRIPCEVAFSIYQEKNGQEVVCSVFQDIRERKQVEETQGRLAVLEERQRLARELHDSTSQVLYSIQLNLRATLNFLKEGRIEQATETVNCIIALAKGGLDEMRALLFELRPESLITEGLLGLLQRQITSLKSRYGLEVEIHLNQSGEPDLPLDYKNALYRVAREALYNVVKHANTERAELHMNWDSQAVQLTIQDNGIGFNVSAEYPEQYGLRSMRERIQRLPDAQLTIESKPGKGTKLDITIPMPRQSFS